jgi:hypothetical protein
VAAVSHVLGLSDLLLLDALVGTNIISLPARVEVQQNAESGRICTYINERGLANLNGGSTIVLMLAEREMEKGR